MRVKRTLTLYRVSTKLPIPSNKHASGLSWLLKSFDVVADIKTRIQFNILGFIGINNIFGEAQKMSTGKLDLLLAFETRRHFGLSR